jgi:UDP-N-acetylmuramate dehydrogenase
VTAESGARAGPGEERDASGATTAAASSDALTTGDGPTTAEPFDAVGLGTAIQRRIGVKTSRDEPLARFTTMRVGGPADLFATAHNVHELRALIRFARSRELPHTLLGRGSNVVIADAGIRGLVIQDRAEGSKVDGDRYTAEAGVPMARAATETQRAGLSGLEFGLAVPGTVGGAVWANAGAHDSDIAAVLESADILLGDGSEARVSTADLDLAYRDSRLKRPPRPGLATEIVLAATFRLVPASAEAIRERLDEIRRWRQAHQPLGLPSAGSFFRNPSGDSAGRLIDEAGLKGFRLGGAVVSEKHANFIVNDQRGTAADVRALGDYVRDEVARRFGARLEHEAVFLGDWDGWPWPGIGQPERAA